jgi:HK97 family phage portal protein
MGIFSRAESKQTKPSVLAQYAPQNLNDPYTYSYFTSIDRSQALGVPAVVRARNLICGTIAAMPLELYRKSTGEELGKPIWLDQPAFNQPRSVSIAYTVDNLLFFGVSYWRVTERYQEDLRPARFEWLAHHRVTPQYNKDATEIESYLVDGYPVSNNDMVTFQGLSDGILTMGGRVLQAALDLEKASAIAASTPMPSGYIKNSGADLDPKEVQGLLSAWKQARANRSTAYLTSTLEYNPVSFSPKDMMYNEAIQNLATEIARLCNVPAYYVSAEMNNSMTYANVQDERKQFLSLSLQPFISAIEDRLSMDDITARGNVVKFDIDKNFLRTDPLQELAVIEKLLSLNLITQEQAMEMTDLTPNGSQGME